MKAGPWHRVAVGPEPGGPGPWRLFELAFRPWLRRALSGIRIEGIPDPAPDPSLPLLLVANHASWFDGFLLREVHRALERPGALRTIMLTRELKGRPILRMLGGTGFDPERPQSLRAALRELASLRERGPLTVSFFPQGRIRPSWSEPLGFRPGIELLARTLRPCTLLPVGLHLEAGNRVRPTAYISVGDPIGVGGDSPGPGVTALESAVRSRLDRLHQHLERYGEDGPDEWPPAQSSIRPS